MPRGNGPPPTCDCGECKVCKNRAAQRAYRLRHPDRIRAAQKRSAAKHKAKRDAAHKAWVAANPDKAFETQRRYHVKKRFGLTWEEYQALVAIRGEVCWICGTDDPQRGRKSMCVDHDHATGTVRGLLCYSCNDGLGRFNDDPEMVERALAYLRG